MRFDNGWTHGFSSNAFPWDLPMLYLGEEEEQQHKGWETIL
jgi:hypothetical protein